MSDRIVVIHEGVTRQSGTPVEIYHAPSCYFVASFVGNANVLPVEVGSGRAAEGRVHMADTDATVHVRDIPPDIQTGWISMRPETLRLTGPEEADIVGRVTDISFLGSHIVWRVAVGDHEIRVHGKVSEDGLARSDEVVGIKLDPKWVRFLQD